MKHTTYFILGLIIGFLFSASFFKIAIFAADFKNEEKCIHAPMSHGVAGSYSTIVIDSCEYIEAFNRLAHKGNCTFCAERKKNEVDK